MQRTARNHTSEASKRIDKSMPQAYDDSAVEKEQIPLVVQVINRKDAPLRVPEKYYVDPRYQAQRNNLPLVSGLIPEYREVVSMPSSISLRTLKLMNPAMVLRTQGPPPVHDGDVGLNPAMVLRTQGPPPVHDGDVGLNPKQHKVDSWSKQKGLKTFRTSSTTSSRLSSVEKSLIKYRGQGLNSPLENVARRKEKRAEKSKSRFGFFQKRKKKQAPPVHEPSLNTPQNQQTSKLNLHYAKHQLLNDKSMRGDLFVPNRSLHTYYPSTDTSLSSNYYTELA